MELILGHNQYGKAQIRMVVVDRTEPRHTFVDLTVSITLSGDLEDVHRQGSNAHVVTTDTQKNTVFAFAREQPVGEIEAFGLRLARHFVAAFAPITRARVRIEAAAWNRIVVDGDPHPHAFASAGAEQRLAEIVVDEQRGEWALSGLTDLVVIKTTGSEFAGYPTDRYTTLPETTDRILATSVTARWRHGTLRAAGEWDSSFTAARAAMLERFATHHSLSLQQTLFQMAGAAIEASPGIAEVRLSAPNRHHFLQDLTPFGLDNPNTVFRVEDRPYGLIETQVLVPDAPDAGPAWDAYPLI